MKRDLQQFIAERAEQLAIMHLTRRKELLIKLTQSDCGIDLLVMTSKGQLPTGRVFGVQVKAQDEMLRATPTHLSTYEQDFSREIPFPVCTLLFTMDDDQGYYKWTQYPDSEFNQPIKLPARDEWHPLNEQAIGKIIADVDAWYDARRHSAA